MTTLNLGCGADKHTPNTVNVDISPDVKPDIVADLEQTPWPWASDAFDHIIASHVFEHLESVPWDELVRVAVDGATLELTYPIGHTRFEDPTHRQYWNITTSEFLSGNTKHRHEIDCDFALINRQITWDIPQSDPLLRWYTRLRERLYGAGAWLEGIPGLYGQVKATYRIHK